MKLIACVDSHWGIGKNGGMLFHLPGDLAHFRETTTGQVVIMGRKTLATLPGGRPLANRKNIVLSHTPGLRVPGAVCCAGLKELWPVLQGCDPDSLYVIGGGEIYRLLAPYCSAGIITQVEADGGADTFMPCLPAWGWLLAQQGERQTQPGKPALCYRINLYESTTTLPFTEAQI